MYLTIFNYISAMLFDAITDCPFRDSKVLRYSFYCRYLTEITSFNSLLKSPLPILFSALCALLIVYAAFLPCWALILRLNIFQSARFILPVNRIIKPQIHGLELRKLPERPLDAPRGHCFDLIRCFLHFYIHRLKIKGFQLFSAVINHLYTAAHIILGHAVNQPIILL